jgi:hypothetical protein
VPVRQIQVEQHQVDRLGPQHRRRRAGRVRDPDHHEPVDPLGVRLVRLGDQRFVLDDQDPDAVHGRTGSRTQISAPPDSAADTA